MYGCAGVWACVCVGCTHKPLLPFSMILSCTVESRTVYSAAWLKCHHKQSESERERNDTSGERAACCRESFSYLCFYQPHLVENSNNIDTSTLNVQVEGNTCVANKTERQWCLVSVTSPRCNSELRARVNNIRGTDCRRLLFTLQLTVLITKANTETGANVAQDCCK